MADDRELQPGEKMIASVLSPLVEDQRDMAKQIETLRREYEAPCDIIMLAVPERKGRPFVDKLGSRFSA